MTRPPIRTILIGAAIGLGATVLAAAVGITELAEGIERKTYDWRVAQTATRVSPSSPVVIVAINESSVRALEPVVGRWPWPRLVHASAIDYLKRAGAKVIAYDVLFLEPEGRSETVINGHSINGRESDEAFVTAVRNAGNVVLLSDAIFEGLANAPSTDSAPLVLPGATFQPGPGFQPRPIVTLPFGDLARAAAGIGHNFLAKDESDSSRRMLPFIENHGVHVPSLGVAAALRFLQTPPSDVRVESDGMLRIGDIRMPLTTIPTPSGDPSRQVVVRLPRPNTNDPAKETFPTFSFYDVVLSADNVESGRPPAIPMSAFDGKLVFIGTTAAGLYDRYSTPFDSGAAGVELHAALADNIISHAFMRRVSFAADAAVAVFGGVVTGILAAVLPVALATGTAVAFIAGLVGLLTYEIGHGVWISVVMPSLAAGLALFGGVAWRYFVEDRSKREMRRLFGRFVSNDVIDQLVADPALVRLGGQRRAMTVLFSDIRGFTAASERATPEAVVAQLNEYFGAMVEVLFRHQGTLDKFVGDMVMGLFGAPLVDARHADHAVAAALDMSDTLDRLNEKWRGEGKPVLNIGIGINSGEMIAGNIGSEAIMSYTVIGDAVNLGSRLESLNKEYGTRILVSDATRAMLTLPVNARHIGAVTVKGRTQPVEVFEITAKKEGTPS